MSQRMSHLSSVNLLPSEFLQSFTVPLTDSAKDTHFSICEAGQDQMFTRLVRRHASNGSQNGYGDVCKLGVIGKRTWTLDQSLQRSAQCASISCKGSKLNKRFTGLYKNFRKQSTESYFVFKYGKRAYRWHKT